MKAAYRWVIAGLMVAGIIAAMFGVRVPRAYACDCPTMEPSWTEEDYYRQEFERASAVFSAQALNTSGPTGNFDTGFAKFQVLEVWKGPVPPTISVTNDTSSCGISIEEGEILLVYVYASPGLSIEKCSPTTRLQHAERQLEMLGAGTILATQPPTNAPPLTLEVPEQDQDLEQSSAFDPTIGVVLLAVIGLLVLALVIVMRRGGRA